MLVLRECISAASREFVQSYDTREADAGIERMHQCSKKSVDAESYGHTTQWKQVIHKKNERNQ